MRVIDVLISATAAATEIRTGRFNAMRRFFSKIDNLRFGELLFLAGDFCGDQLAFDRERNKNRLAVFARDTFSSKSDVLDFKIDRAQEITVAARSMSVALFFGQSE